MENCDYLCRPCHRWFTDHPFNFRDWLVERMGSNELADLETRANSRWNGSYLEVLAYLTSYTRNAA